ncbi:MAG: hypothetical protein V1698_01300 [bacterium]
MLNLYFGIGILLQSGILLIKNKTDFKEKIPGILTVLTVSSLAFIPFCSKPAEYNLQTRFLLFFIAFAIIFILTFRESMFVRLNPGKETLIAITLMFWMAAFINHNASAIFKNSLYWTALIPSIAIIAVAILNIKTNSFWKLLTNLWVLTVSILLLLSPVVKSFGSFFSSIISGMVFLYLTTISWFIIESFLPPKFFSDKDSRNLKNIFEKRFGSPISPAILLILIVIIPLLFAANVYYHFAPGYLLVGIFLLAIPQLSAFYHYPLDKKLLSKSREQKFSFFR